MGLGGIALADLLTPFDPRRKIPNADMGEPARIAFAPKAKRVIYLFQSGRSSHSKHSITSRCSTKGTESNCPIRFAWDSGSPACPATRRRCRWPGRSFKFQQHGQSGAWVSELLPHTAKVVDDLCIIRSMYTEAINHDPAITFFQTGSQIAGRPSMGAWLSYGLGSENENLPAFVVLISDERQWGSAALLAPLGKRFSPVAVSGRPVPLRQRSGALPEQPGRRDRRKPPQDARPARASCNAPPTRRSGRPRDPTRIAQYEMAYRMQTSRARSDGHLQGAAAHLRPLRPGCAQARHIRRELPAGPAAGRTRRPVHPALSPGLGPARRPARTASQRSAAKPTRPAPRWSRT